MAAQPAPAPQRAPQGARLVPIGHDGWHGHFVVRDAADHIQRVVASTGGFYEAEMLNDIRRRLTPGGVFVDVGANIGNHTLFAAAVCGARVLAFEPSPSLVEHCAENLAINAVEGQVELRQAGVSDHAGQAALQPGPAHNAGMTRLAPLPDAANDSDATAITLVALDEELATRALAPQVIKVDVEGMEPAVLRGAIATLMLHRPALYVEAATEPEFRAVRAVLDPLGYAPVARFNATPTYLFLPQAA